jgi:hypothetical protein
MLGAVTEELLKALVLAGTAEVVHRHLFLWEGLCHLPFPYCPPA